MRELSQQDRERIHEQNIYLDSTPKRAFREGAEYATKFERLGTDAEIEELKKSISSLIIYKTPEETGAERIYNFGYNSAIQKCLELLNQNNK